MTPEQKYRIRQAAAELGAALTAANGDFDVDVRQIEMRSIEQDRPNYAYTVKVSLKTEEVIA